MLRFVVKNFNEDIANSNHKEYGFFTSNADLIVSDPYREYKLYGSSGSLKEKGYITFQTFLI